MNPTIHNPKSEKTTRIRGYPYPYPQYKPQILYSRFFVSEKYKLKKTNANGEEDPKQRNPSKAFLEREQTEEEKKLDGVKEIWGFVWKRKERKESIYRGKLGRGRRALEVETQTVCALSDSSHVWDSTWRFHAPPPRHVFVAFRPAIFGDNARNPLLGMARPTQIDMAFRGSHKELSKAIGL